MLTALTALAASFLAQPGTGAGAAPGPGGLPTILITADDTRIDRSCRVAIPPGTVIADAAGDGVIHIVADGVTVEFVSGSALRGAPAGTAPDTMKGVGIRIDGRRNITIKGGTVSGFKVGLHANRAGGLTLEGLTFDDNFRQRLRSTPQAEDGGDWLWPHANDKGEWRENYGAAACVEESAGVTIRNVTVRRGQNGIILDRVQGSRVFDNDCSFLSGWGLAMWRSSGNAVCRNALDFCVRGYSHGVYNRGQDSAGILMFEQCSANLIAENSVTHGGDGLFGFAGKEAIGDAPAPPDFSYERKGCNDNIILRNDFSYAPAHGLEMTFSHGNRIFGNRFVQNAICGIWGGYSQGMTIAENTFAGNGEMAYGLERGGINIEHGSANLIVGNAFTNDRCGVHLWWDDDKALLTKPGVVGGGYRGVADNVIAGNRFEGVSPALHLRDLSPGKDRVRGTVFARNTVEGGAAVDAPQGAEVITDRQEPMYVLPEVAVIGEKRPVGARSALAGREKIVMTEWGPWDHASPLVRRVSSAGGGDVYAVFGAQEVVLPRPTMGAVVEPLRAEGGEAARFAVRPAGGLSLAAYDLELTADRERLAVRGVALDATWTVRVFPWPADPREDPESWRRGATGEGAVELTWKGPLSLPFGSAGPRSIKAWQEVRDRLPERSRYGVTAETTLNLPRGRWRVVTMSDDGVRVILTRPGGEDPGSRTTLIENWTWHGPTRDTGEFEHAEDGPVGLTVEYFQIDGHAVLDLRLEAAG
ncbi:MAG: right-handed parallel beta-helix repeat-containing protein [Phycisphaerales bacterium]